MPHDLDVLANRLLIESVHELGHTLHLTHCQEYPLRHGGLAFGGMDRHQRQRILRGVPGEDGAGGVRL